MPHDSSASAARPESPRSRRRRAERTVCLLASSHFRRILSIEREDGGRGDGDDARARVGGRGRGECGRARAGRGRGHVARAQRGGRRGRVPGLRARRRGPPAAVRPALQPRHARARAARRAPRLREGMIHHITCTPFYRHI